MIAVKASTLNIPRLLIVKSHRRDPEDAACPHRPIASDPALGRNVTSCALSAFGTTGATTPSSTAIANPMLMSRLSRMPSPTQLAFSRGAW